jgi:protein-S-isoprenylcysteine O-methyltransferase Ste14
MGDRRHCRAFAQLARALAVPAGRLGCRLARRDRVCSGAGAGHLGPVTITRAGSNVRTNLPTTNIVESGPYRFTRNPIYLGMFLGTIGLAIVFADLWLLMMLVPFALVIRYGVVAREEAYLDHKFGDVYRGYCSRVRRWL